jgi:G3E family GTPase
MADPAEVVDAVTDAYVARLAALERVIALLHPVALPEGSLAEPAVRNAIRCADDIILNKRDLYIAGHWEGFKQAALAHNPYARLWETMHARLDVGVLLAAGKRADPRPAPNVTLDRACVAPVYQHQRAADHPLVLTVRLPGPLDRTRFTRWLECLPAGVERAKGFLRFAGEPDLHEFQCFPPGARTIAPLTLLDEPDHAAVLIGRDYDHDRCRAALLACLDEKGGARSPGPTAPARP